MTRGSIAQYDCVVIITDHKAFDYDALLDEADLIVDTRNAIKRPDAEGVQARRPARRRRSHAARQIPTRLDLSVGTPLTDSAASSAQM